jgi:hypothetical protein
MQLQSCTSILQAQPESCTPIERRFTRPHVFTWSPNRQQLPTRPSTHAGAGGLGRVLLLGATRRAAAQAGLPNAVTEQEAADLMREAEVFLGLDDFHTRLGLGKADVGRDDLPRAAPKALDENAQIRWLRAIDDWPHARDRLLARLRDLLTVAEIGGHSRVTPCASTASPQTTTNWLPYAT